MEHLNDAISVHAAPLKVFGLLELGTRMTVVRLPGGGTAIISPVKASAELVDAVAAIGEPRVIVAPNLLHHLFAGQWQHRFPNARLVAPRGLAKKRPDLRIDATLDEGLPHELDGTLDMLPVDGVPSVREYAFLHRPSGTLIVTDLLFNQPATGHDFTTSAYLRVAGARGVTTVPRILLAMVRDRPAFQASLRAILDQDWSTVVLCHGTVMTPKEAGAARVALERVIGD